MNVKYQAVILSFLVAGIAHAAPPADPELVDLWSHMDELHAAHGVREGGRAARAEARRAARRTSASTTSWTRTATPGSWSSRATPSLAERYQYGRTAQHRFASASMAKTVLGMLVGIAVHERKIASIDDRAEKYVPALKGHPYGQTSIRDLLTMSSGVEWHEAYGWDRDQGLRLIENTFNGATSGGADTVLEFNRREAPAGTRFHYASGDSEVLGLVLRAAVGMPLARVPLGEDLAAHGRGGGRDLARRQGGERDRLLLHQRHAARLRPLRPAPRQRRRARREADHPRRLDEGGHPRERDAPPRRVRHAPQRLRLPDLAHRSAARRFAALGVRGQAIYVDPASKVVVVHTAVWDENVDRDARVAQFQLWGRILKTLSQKERAA